jgi:hypothetical protein
MYVCAIHHARMLLFLQSSVSPDLALQRKSIKSLLYTSSTCRQGLAPARGPRGVAATSCLQHITSPSQRDSSLVTDVNFVILKAQLPSTFQTCVKVYRASEPIVATNVHYPGETLATVHGGQANFYYKSKFRQIYCGDETNGMTVSDIQHQLVQAGVTTRRFTALSWWSIVDMISFARILKGKGDLVAPIEDFTLSCPLGGCVDDDLNIHF